MARQQQYNSKSQGEPGSRALRKKSWSAAAGRGNLECWLFVVGIIKVDGDQVGSDQKDSKVENLSIP